MEMRVEIKPSSKKFMSLKLPPFALCADYECKTAQIYCGVNSLEKVADVYSYSSANEFALAIELSKNPFEYKWPVENKYCAIYNLGNYENVSLLANALLSFGAKKVFCVIDDDLKILSGNVIKIRKAA